MKTPLLQIISTLSPIVLLTAACALQAVPAVPPVPDAGNWTETVVMVDVSNPANETEVAGPYTKRFPERITSSGFVIDRPGKPETFIATFGISRVPDANIRIRFTGTDASEASRIRYEDPVTGIAILEIPGSRKGIRLEEGSRNGQSVIAIGYSAFSNGERPRLHAVCGRIVESRTVLPGEIPRFIRHDAPYEMGFGGGPLLDERLDAIGIHAYRFTGHHVAMFALPATLIAVAAAEAEKRTVTPSP